MCEPLISADEAAVILGIHEKTVRNMARAGYEPSGGGFNNAVGRLRTLELISGRGEMKASDDLFD